MQVIKQFNDSLGNVMVIDGNGHYLEFDDEHPEVLIAEGNVLGGSWEGEVKGRILKYGISYTSIYKNGKLISGTSTDSLGNAYSFTEEETPLSYKGGMQKFYNRVARNLMYPMKAQKQNIQGKVYVKATIDKTGRQKDIQVSRGFNAECDKEALRVVGLCQDWIPAKIRGVGVDCNIYIPVSFSLSNTTPEEEIIDEDYYMRYPGYRPATKSLSF